MPTNKSTAHQAQMNSQATNASSGIAQPHFHDEPTARDLSRQQRILWLCFLLISTFMVVEAVGGWLTGSLALLSDAGHMLSDAAALGATLLAFKIGEKSANPKKTFGYKRFEILVAGANGATLIIIAVMICVEAFHRLQTPVEVASKGMLIVASIGFIVNVLVAWLLHRGSNEHSNTHTHAHHDEHHEHADAHDTLTNETNAISSKTKNDKNLNMHSAFLHVLGDLLGSVAAIIAALAMMWFGWACADPVVSVLVSVLILISGYRVVKQSAHILMEGTPEGIDLEMVADSMTQHDAVIAVHDLHLWSITSGLHAMSGHVVVDGQMSIQQGSELIKELEARLASLGISHTTIQIESVSHPHTFSHLETSCALSEPSDTTTKN